MSITGAYMVPHPPVIMAEVGRGEEKKIQKTIDAFTEVGRRIGNLRPDTIIVTSPHAHMYSNYFQISNGKNVVKSSHEHVVFSKKYYRIYYHYLPLYVNGK